MVKFIATAQSLTEQQVIDFAISKGWNAESAQTALDFCCVYFTNLIVNEMTSRLESEAREAAQLQGAAAVAAIRSQFAAAVSVVSEEE